MAQNIGQMYVEISNCHYFFDKFLKVFYLCLLGIFHYHFDLFLLMLLTFIILYMIGTLLIGWWASRFVKNAADFVVAGRRMPLMVVAAGLFATWFGSETVMGASTAFVEDGIQGIIEDPFGAALCLVFVGVFMAKPLYRLNLLTFSDYFKYRFSHKAETLSAIVMIPSYWGWIAAQLIALATIFNVITGFPISYGIYIFAAVVMFYTYIGGMWAVSITDFVQTIMIIVGMIIVMLGAVSNVGGWAILWEKSQLEPQTFRFLPKANTKDVVAYVAAWITVGLGSVPQQDVFMRVMSAKNEKTAVWGAYLSGIMYITVGLMPIVMAYCGKILYPDLLQGDAEQRQMLIPYMVMQHSGIVVQIFFYGALLSAILSTASGAILAPATVIGENIIKPYYPQLTDKQLLKIMRWSVIGVTFGAIIFANLGSSIYELVRQSSEISLVALFVPMFAGLYWQKSSSVGAMASMIAGLVVWFLLIVLHHYYSEETREHELGWVIGADFSPMVLGLAASVLALIIGSLWKPKIIVA
jgi:solute:Na+ symporter, SSS family